MNQETQQFIERSRNVWGDRWDYSLTEYTKTRNHIKVRCKVHNEVFEQYPYSHLHHHVGCTCCKNQNKLTTKTIIERGRAVFGDRFDYSKTHYVNSRTPIVITCREHGDFTQFSHSHTYGIVGCKHCRNNNGRARKTTDDFIKRATEVWGDRWNYDKVVYQKSHDHVIITCREHGDFTQTPMNHVHHYIGCPECQLQAKRDRACTSDDFIAKARDVWGDRFDYSKTVYTLSRNKVIITCHEHGDFEQIANNHLSGMDGCHKCCKSLNRKTDNFIKKSKAVWGDRWDYSKTIYSGVNNVVTITCKEHGDFQQKPSGHLRKKCGCNGCKKMQTYDTDYFIERSKAVWGDRFTYDKFEYVKMVIPAIFTCKKHGDFKQTPSLHIKGYNGCPKCRKNRAK
ncbi:hypothetical protein [Photobacterium leiognathi]|uniref:hypothetical protein n=1 Tax=Photobacterium leiognathi TaxID=553611 RepID=UPI0029829465|nr:hypothetical protein [Photobacterium leiognathi]